MVPDGYHGAHTLVGEDQRWLGIIAAPGQRLEVTGRDYWPGANIYCIYLVRPNVGSGYLGQVQC